ncbi:DUF3119 family protein [Candidatus Synechococcus spongiarum]|uniref:Glycerol dehydrogenase n=1 Tax=Candidatus Synechococcus spongiarum LMB bulk15N TaxID=1943583 RepID=A0A1T1CZY9_9SYNE|nr:DUF3119 family protein [Candidatus Synechococcus spongiarum]OOV34189.1 hypothetical protein BV53_06275 [Candidatus Synechococcus spongiarum LMB bulk15N]
MDSGKRVVVTPGLGLPSVVLLLSVPLYLTKLLIASFVAAVLGAFLMFQSWWVRLVFTPEAMELENGFAVVRRFPYEDWRGWRLLWKRVPILLYFREVNGIHIVPMIVDGQKLGEQLEQRLGHLNVAASRSADATTSRP